MKLHSLRHMLLGTVVILSCLATQAFAGNEAEIRDRSSRDTLPGLDMFSTKYGVGGAAGKINMHLGEMAAQSRLAGKAKTPVYFGIPVRGVEAELAGIVQSASLDVHEGSGLPLILTSEDEPETSYRLVEMKQGEGISKLMERQETVAERRADGLWLTSKRPSIVAMSEESAPLPEPKRL